MAYEFFKQLTEGKVHKHLDFQGMNISIEIPAGGKRTGTNKAGEKWEHKIDDAYGYIKGTHSPDGEHLDCYVRKNPDKEAKVYVMHQLTVDGSKFDEDKVMLGYSSASEATKAFKKFTFKPDVMFGGMTEFPLEYFMIVAYQASSSHAMLTNEETFEDFVERGLMPRGVISPLTVARRVNESEETAATPSVRDIAARLAALEERRDPYGLMEFARSGEPEGEGPDDYRYVTCDWDYVGFIEACKEHLGWTFQYFGGEPALTKGGMIISKMREHDGYSNGHAFTYTAFSVSGDIDEAELTEVLSGFECSVADINETLMSVNPSDKRRKGNGVVGGFGWWGWHDHEDKDSDGDSGADMGGGDGGGMGESFNHPDHVSSAAWEARARAYEKHGHSALANFARSQAIRHRKLVAKVQQEKDPNQK